LETSNLKRMIILLVLSGVLTACGGGSDGGAAASKSLFSSWSSSTAGAIDLTNAQFDVIYPVRFALSPNMGCDCNIQVSGTETSGAAYISSCVHYGPQNFCAAGTASYTYTNQNATLSICADADGSCDVYR
jgi:hypothetical protein